MNESQSGVPKGETPRFHADAIMGKTIFQVARDLRAIRAELMEMARFVKQEPTGRGILVIEDPRITDQRLQKEWKGMAELIRPELFERLAMVITREGVPRESMGIRVSLEEQSMITALLDSRRSPSTGTLTSMEGHDIPAVSAIVNGRLPRRVRRSSEAFYDILRILINRWLVRAGPLTSLWLAETAGCTYPTVALALAQVEKYLVRHSDRRVELKAFPKESWARLVANANKVRETQRFADHSGHPRSAESLVARLQRLEMQNAAREGDSHAKVPWGVAIGGVPGARRFFPKLDLFGTPRLDLTIHCGSRQPDTDFIHQLDPALKPASGDEPAQVAIHVLRQAHVFFETDSAGVVWADPVECLLDLHEMRFESQVLELIQSLPLPKGRAL